MIRIDECQFGLEQPYSTLADTAHHVTHYSDEALKQVRNLLNKWARSVFSDRGSDLFEHMDLRACLRMGPKDNVPLFHCRDRVQVMCKW